MKERAKGLFAGAICILLLWLTGFEANAEGKPFVAGRATTEQGVILYVKGVESEVDEAAYQIGTEICTIDSVSPIEEAEDEIRTLILWDNSLSVMKKSGDALKEIMVDVVANRSPKETFAIATIGTDVMYQTDYTDDYTVLKQIIEGIEGEDKDAYLIENLYEAILSLNEIGDCGYKRIVLISDGMDAAELGYTRAELDNLIAQTPYPVYSIGVLNKGGEEALQQMFAISRTTAGDYFNLGEVEEKLDIAKALGEDYDILQVKVTVPETIRDGSKKNSLLQLQTASESYDITCEVVLPFAKRQEMTEAEESSEELIETEEPKPVMEELEEEEEISEGLFSAVSPRLLLGVSIGGAVVIIAIIVIVVVGVKSKSKKKPEGNQYAMLDARLKNERSAADAFSNAGAPKRAGGRATVLMNAPTGGQAAGGRRTQMLFGGAAQHRLTLTCTDDPVKTYGCSMADRVLVGRDPESCHVAVNEETVSGIHCEISYENGKIYVKDLGSSNGTSINAVPIAQNVRTEAENGSILKLGRLYYKLTIE